MALVVSIASSDAIQIAATTTSIPTGNFTPTHGSLSPTYLRLIKLHIHPSTERQHQSACGWTYYSPIWDILFQMGFSRNPYSL
jgi:hypothetical protein